MTATAGPGISLMSEFAGLAYYAEIPGVIWDIQRVGPSTGLPTRTSQGDIISTAFLSHGDTKHIMLIPSSPEECFSMALDAFELAEKFQSLIFVMSDLDLGMNNWMADPFKYPEQPISRGKVLSKEDLDRLGGFAVTRMLMAMASATVRCRERTTMRLHTSLAAAATMRSLNTANVRTTSSTTWNASTASLKLRAPSFRVRTWRPANQKSASLPTAPHTGESSRVATSCAMSTTLKLITCG